MKYWKLALTSTLLTFSTYTNAALVERLGGLAYYDTEADLTWLADANYAQTSGYHADGRMTWQQSMDWADGLSVGGVDGWRLADTVDVGNDGYTYTNVYEGVDYGYNITAHSELSNMYYNVLGNTASRDTSGADMGCSAPDFCLANTGPFSNIQTYTYWSATEFAPNTSSAWSFSMSAGFQANQSKSGQYNYAWAVQSGDVSAVPIPASVFLFGSGLIGLIGFAKQKKENEK